jgi:hypothetical protein
MRLIRYIYAEKPEAREQVFQAVKQPAWQYDFVSAHADGTLCHVDR